VGAAVPVRVVIADDEPLIRSGIVGVLEEPGFEEEGSRSWSTDPALLRAHELLGLSPWRGPPSNCHPEDLL
jgi:hypothetical protein